MTLKDFEENIDPVILERGYDYFVNMHVTSLEEDEKGLWFAEVEGTDNYIVNIEIKRSKIKHWYCDCPFEGDICKHVIAVLYAISENESLKKEPVKKKGTKKNKAKKIEMIFDNVTKDDLKEFIKSEFLKDRSLKNKFIVYFAEHIDENAEDKYKILVKNIIKASEDRYGFIDYHSAFSLNKELDGLLNKAQMLLEKRNLKESLSICKVIIEEVPLLIQHMDDSAGGIYGLMEYAFNIFSQVVKKAPPELKDVLFQYCLENCDDEKYHDYDFRDGFLYVLPELISTEEQEQQFLNLIDFQIEVERNKEYPDFRVSSLIKVKIDFLITNGRNEEAWKLVEDNKQYPEFMKMLVDDALENKDFIKAVNLCFEGIKIAKEKSHPGTVTDWHEKLLTIYENTKNTGEIRKMTKKLFFDSHYSMKYYKKLRSTYNKDEWQEICESIIEKIKGENKFGSYYHARTLADIFIEEKYKARLLKLLQLNSQEINFIDEYSKHIKKEYSGELILLYEEGIKKYAENTGRNYYNDVAGYLKKLQKINGGEKKVKWLLYFFRQTYKRRRAMMEILDKNFD